MARRSSRTPDPRLVDARNRVALSRQAMRALDVLPGDYVTFEVEADGRVRIANLTIGLAPPRRATTAGRS
jgi:hypothetical protein